MLSHFFLLYIFCCIFFYILTFFVQKRDMWHVKAYTKLYNFFFFFNNLCKQYHWTYMFVSWCPISYYFHFYFIQFHSNKTASQICWKSIFWKQNVTPWNKNLRNHWLYSSIGFHLCLKVHAFLWECIVERVYLWECTFERESIYERVYIHESEYPLLV